MAWRPARAIDALRQQINSLSPNRSKASDGIKGDDAHSARKSDHNPNKAGAVCAIDITHDPAHGVDGNKLAATLLASQDERIAYIIWNRQIASGTGQGHTAWQWRKYTGSNPHDHHVHISVKQDAKLYDDGRPWALAIDVAPGLAQAPAAPELPVLRKGARGADVEKLQRLLNKAGAILTVDGDFGAKTLAAVKAFQRGKGLVPDGAVGSYSWRALSA